MRYTTEDGGRLNNFAIEPKMYQATPPDGSQQRNYVILGTVATAFVAGLIYVAVAVS